MERGWSLSIVRSRRECDYRTPDKCSYLQPSVDFAVWPAALCRGHVIDGAFSGGAAVRRGSGLAVRGERRCQREGVSSRRVHCPDAGVGSRRWLVGPQASSTGLAPIGPGASDDRLSHIGLVVEPAAGHASFASHGAGGDRIAGPVDVFDGAAGVFDRSVMPGEDTFR